MKKLLTVLLCGAVTLTVANGQIAAFSDDFESGTASTDWGVYYADEETMTAVAMSTAPAPLTGGGDYVGYLQDLDTSYVGIAVSLAGSVNDSNYTVEADVYCYTNDPGGSAYSGLVFYADSAEGIYYKLVADFDADLRFRLYSNKMINYMYTYSKSIDASGVDTSEGWHHMRVVVETLAGGYPSFTCYYDGVHIGDDSNVDSTEYRLSRGQYGVISMQMDMNDGLPGYYDNFIAAPIFSDDFESGTASTDWGVYYADEETMTAVAMSTAPAPLTGGGDYVGYLQDLDTSYVGIAVSLAGSVNDSNYTVEADVYCYTNDPGGSAYSGLVFYADSAEGIYYKLVADFDADLRFRLYSNKMINYMYTYSKSIDASGVDTSEGWHHMRVVVETLAGGYPSFTCYYDGVHIGDDSNVDSTEYRLSRGQYGVISMQMDMNDGLPGYFDNFKAYRGGLLPDVPVVAIEPRSGGATNLPTGFALAQNYPNPFNPSTTIPFQVEVGGRYSLVVYDLSGRQVRSLLNETLVPSSYSVVWDGRDKAGKLVSSGVYIYSLNNGSRRLSDKMVLLK